MTDRRFRFALIAAQAPDEATWAGLAQRAENLGYQTLLVPDTTDTLAPLTACAVAAGHTSTLHVGSWVLASPLRTPEQVAWEAATLATLTGGRFELGLGAGRGGGAGHDRDTNGDQPVGAAADAARLGVPYGSAGERVTRIEQTIAAVERRSGSSPRPRILVAGSGPRMLRLAGRSADTLALALGPFADAARLRQATDQVRAAAGARFDRLELAMNLVSVGDVPDAQLEQWTGVGLSDLKARGSVSVLDGTVDEMVGQLQRMREEYGVSYLATSAAFATALAPVVERLAGR